MFNDSNIETLLPLWMINRVSVCFVIIFKMFITAKNEFNVVIIVERNQFRSVSDGLFLFIHVLSKRNYRLSKIITP